MSPSFLGCCPPFWPLPPLILFLASTILFKKKCSNWEWDNMYILIEGDLSIFVGINSIEMPIQLFRIDFVGGDTQVISQELSQLLLVEVGILVFVISWEDLVDVLAENWTEICLGHFIIIDFYCQCTNLHITTRLCSIIDNSSSRAHHSKYGSLDLIFVFFICD